MKVGDLVKLKQMHRRQPARIGIIIELFEKKCWRTEERGRSINWDIVKPEPHAAVMINGDTISIPIVDLVLVE